SELVVAKAIDTGSATAWTNLFTGTRAMSATGNRTQVTKTSSATYSVTSSFNKFSSTPNPMCPTVYAIAAPTPMGANIITMFVNLNIVSTRLSMNDNIGRFCFSFSIPTATPNKTLNTTI